MVPEAGLEPLCREKLTRMHTVCIYYLGFCSLSVCI